MKMYKDYLEQQNYSETTIESYDNAKSKFIDWCKQNQSS